MNNERCACAIPRAAAFAQFAGSIIAIMGRDTCISISCARCLGYEISLLFFVTKLMIRPTWCGRHGPMHGAADMAQPTWRGRHGTVTMAV